VFYLLLSAAHGAGATNPERLNPGQPERVLHALNRVHAARDRVGRFDTANRTE